MEEVREAHGRPAGIRQQMVLEMEESKSKERPLRRVGRGGGGNYDVPFGSVKSKYNVWETPTAILIHSSFFLPSILVKQYGMGGPKNHGFQVLT